jgi:hypothetical protein
MGHQWPSYYLCCQLFSGQAFQNFEWTRCSSLNPTENLFNIICAISGHLTICSVSCFLRWRTRILSRLRTAAYWPFHFLFFQLFLRMRIRADKAKQPESHRQPVQHHLGHQWPSYYLFCQLFSVQAYQNFERTKRSSLNPTDNLYNIICPISGHLTSHCVSCFYADTPEL